MEMRTIVAAVTSLGYGRGASAGSGGRQRERQGSILASGLGNAIVSWWRAAGTSSMRLVLILLSLVHGVSSASAQIVIGGEERSSRRPAVEIDWGALDALDASVAEPGRAAGSEVEQGMGGAPRSSSVPDLRSTRPPPRPALPSREDAAASAGTDPTAEPAGRSGDDAGPAAAREREGPASVPPQPMLRPVPPPAELSPPRRTVPQAAPDPPALGTVTPPPRPAILTERPPAPGADSSEPPPRPQRLEPEPGAPAPVGRSVAALPDGQGFRILFAEGSDQLSESAGTLLSGLARRLRTEPDLSLQMRAYAAGDADAASRARRLSLNRALVVRTFLIDRGADSRQVSVRALGNTASEGPADRVDLILSP